MVCSHVFVYVYGVLCGTPFTKGERPQSVPVATARSLWGACRALQAGTGAWEAGSRFQTQFFKETNGRVGGRWVNFLSMAWLSPWGMQHG